MEKETQGGHKKMKDVTTACELLVITGLTFLIIVWNLQESLIYPERIQPFLFFIQNQSFTINLLSTVILRDHYQH